MVKRISRKTVLLVNILLICLIGVAGVAGVAGIAGAQHPILLKAKGSLNKIENKTQKLEEKTGTGLYLVQWKGNVYEKEKIALRNMGVKFYGYIPNNAFLVSMDASHLSLVQSKTFVDRVLSYTSNMKLASDLSNMSILSLPQEIIVVVQITAQANLTALQAYFGSRLQKISRDLYMGKIHFSIIDRLVQREDVLWVEKYDPIQLAYIGDLLDDPPVVIPTDPTYTGYESGTKVMNAEVVWEAGYTGEGERIAVADTGVDTGNIDTIIPDLQNQIYSGHAMGLGGTSWEDPHSHGTHTAGSIIGNGSSSNGQIQGAAFGGQLVAQGMWSPLMGGMFPVSVDKLFGVAYTDGARIHSNSWGMPLSGEYNTLARAVDAFSFQHLDFLAVFAAGNSGEDMDRDGVIDTNSVITPGTAKNVMTVGASKNFLLKGGIQRKMKNLRQGKEKWGVEPLASSRLSDSGAGMAAFSSRGPTNDGRIKPDIVAPGTNIVSSRSTHTDADLGWGPFSEHYLYMGGTSMSTPLVSGALGVLREILRKKHGIENVSAALLKAAMINGAHDLYPGQFGFREKGQEQPTARPNNHQGWGRVDMASFLGNMIVLPTQGLGTGEEQKFTITVPSEARALKVTMVYTDAPGTLTAQKALVNDLDMVVEATSGAKHYPNRLFTADRLNNVENIDIFQLEKGEYTVTVKGFNVPQGINGKQPYALVYLLSEK